MSPMAGGMNKRGSGIPLGERRRSGPPAPPPDRSPAPSPARAPDRWPEVCPVRHCWVAGAADGRGVKRPGLLVEWRRSADGAWQGRVVYAAALRGGAWALVEEWLPADMLAPADFLSES